MVGEVSDAPVRRISVLARDTSDDGGPAAATCVHLANPGGEKRTPQRSGNRLHEPGQSLSPLSPRFRTEIHDDDRVQVPFNPKHQVLWFQVPVYAVERVEVREPGNDLGAHGEAARRARGGEGRECLGCGDETEESGAGGAAMVWAFWLWPPPSHPARDRAGLVLGEMVAVPA